MNDNILCKNCGYEKGVHSMFNYYCPLDDPYEMKREREWNFDSYFEPIDVKAGISPDQTPEKEG